MDDIHPILTIFSLIESLVLNLSDSSLRDGSMPWKEL